MSFHVSYCVDWKTKQKRSQIGVVAIKEKSEQPGMGRYLSAAVGDG